MWKVWSRCLLQPPPGTGSYVGMALRWGLAGLIDHIPLVRMGLGHPSVTEGPHHTCPVQPPFGVPKPMVLGFEPPMFLLLAGNGKREQGCVGGAAACFEPLQKNGAVQSYLFIYVTMSCGLQQ